jgi:hypothetical protein
MANIINKPKAGEIRVGLPSLVDVLHFQDERHMLGLSYVIRTFGTLYMAGNKNLPFIS